MTVDETWRPVPGYEGRYEVSDAGRVRSCGFYSGNRWGTRTWRPGRIRKLVPSDTGHLTVELVDADGARCTVKVHRLVLLAFVGEAPHGKPYGLHGDDDPTNNRVENLRWGTPGDNSDDAVRNGGHTQARKETCELGHLLVAPNLVDSSAALGHRSCLACKLAQANHRHDENLRAQGRERTRYNRGRDGFQRRRGESVVDEAHRRYRHLTGQG